MLSSVAALNDLFLYFPVPILALRDQAGHLSLAFCNIAFAKLCERRLETLVDSPASLLLPVDGHVDPGPAIARSLAQGGTLALDAAVMALGHRRRIRLLGQGVGIGSGLPKAEHVFLAIVRDLSEETRQALAKDSVERMLSAVIANIHLPLVMIGQNDARIILANAAAARLFEHATEGMTGRHLSMLFAPDEWQVMGERFLKEAVGEFEYRGPVGMASRQGSPLKLEVRGMPMGEIGGKAMRMLTFCPFDPPLPKSQAGLEGIRKGLALGHPLVAGRLQIVGLDDISTVFGDRWGAMREQALSIAERTIRQELSSQDHLQRMADDSFVIGFNDISEVDAAAKARRIGDRIRDRLLGGAASKGRVDTAVTTLVPADLAEQPAEDLADFLVRKLTSRHEDGRRHVQALLRDAMAKAKLDPQVVVRPDGVPLTYWMAELASPWRQQIAAALTAVGDDDMAGFEADLVTLSVAVDWYTVRQRDGTLVVPLRFGNLMQPRQLDRYVAVIRNLPQSLRQSLLLHLTHLPPGTASSRIVGMVQTLGPYCIGVVLELPGLDYVLDPMGTRVGVVSLDFRRLDYADPNVRSRVRRLVRNYHLRKIKVLVQNVPDRDEAVKLVVDGADMVTIAR